MTPHATQAPEEPAGPGDRRLASCQRGGVIIATIFAAMFIIGLLFAMHGLGRALRYGDAKRDAADTVAQSSAVIYAHAMNQVALLNLVKVTTLSILATHLSMFNGIKDGVAYATFMTVVKLDLSYIPDLGRLIAKGVQLGIWLAQRLPTLLDILRTADRAQEALRTEVHQMAEERVRPLVLVFPGVTKAFVGERTLPVKAAPVFVPCLRLPGVPLMLYGAFKDLDKKDVMAIAIASSLLLVEPICMGFAAATGSTKEVSARLGAEEFQVRGYSLGLPLLRIEESGVLVAAWRGYEGGGEVVRLRDALSKVGIAQAEFYFDGDPPQTGPLSPLLFELKWRNRMRRYRDADGFGQFRAGCARAGGGAACGPAANALEQGKELIVH